ncbi:MAG: 50S ribosomal protein L31, partial [Saprospiraceae bacterium]|nr:50S ribosomal protein L31 [Saprospiraceae bacterium]
MKAGIHPENYRTVIFKDFSCDESWLGKSCAPSRETMKWDDGNYYP